MQHGISIGVDMLNDDVSALDFDQLSYQVVKFRKANYFKSLTGYTENIPKQSNLR